MIEIENIKEELKSRNILHIRRGHLSLNPMYKHLLDDSSISLIENWQSNFRSIKEGWWCLLHNIDPDNRPRCPICGSISKFNGGEYNLTCGKCNYNAYPEKKEKSKQTCLEKYGVENPFSSKEIRKKSKQTCLEKYGTTVANQFSTKEAKQKYEQHCLEKYGTKNAGQSKEAKNKRKQTMLDKYGVEHNFQLLDGSKHSKEIWDKNHDDIIQKRQQTCLEKFGVKEICQSQYFKDKSKQTKFERYNDENYINLDKIKQTKLERYNDCNYHNIAKYKCTLYKRIDDFEVNNDCTQFNTLIEKYGQGWKTLNLPIMYDGRFRFISNKYITEIKKYASANHNLVATSKQEKEVLDYIKTLTKEKIYENRKNIIRDENQKYELDMYIPSLNIAIEYNGNYWHSTVNKDKYYHQRKSILCYKNGIQLIHIYEFQWENQKEQIKKQLRKLFNSEDCSEYNWIKPIEYNKYKLSKPLPIYKIKRKNNLEYIVYDEGKFIKLNDE